MRTLPTNKYYVFKDDYGAFEFQGILTGDEYDHGYGGKYTIANLIMTKKPKTIFDKEEAKSLKGKITTLSKTRYKAIYLRELTEAEKVLYGI